MRLHLASFFSFYWCQRAKGIACLATAALFALVALLSAAVALYLHSAPCPPLEVRPTPRRAGLPHLPLPHPLPAVGSAFSSECAFLHGLEAAVFLHVYPANAWRMILDDTVAVLQSSPLRACGVRYFHGLPLAQWPYTGADDAFTSYHAGTAAPTSELDTLTALHDYCVAHPQAVVSYIHGKGTRHPAETDFTRFSRQWDWRRLHLYFLVEMPQGCLAALASGNYDACGVNKRRSAFFTDQPRPHYNGNFWWARCEYVRSLPRPYESPLLQGPSKEDPTYAPEMWLGSSGKARLFSCFDSRVEHYQHHFSRSNYVGASCDANVEEFEG